MLSTVASTLVSWVEVPATVLRIPLPVMVSPLDEERPAVWRPPAMVDDAVDPERLRNEAETPLVNVEVPETDWPTTMGPEKVDVAPLPKRVVVAVDPIKI